MKIKCNNVRYEIIEKELILKRVKESPIKILQE